MDCLKWTQVCTMHIAQDVTVNSGTCSHRTWTDAWTALERCWEKWKKCRKLKEREKKCEKTEYTICWRVAGCSNTNHSLLCSQSLCSAKLYTQHPYGYITIRWCTRSTFAIAFAKRQRQETKYHAVDQVLSVAAREGQKHKPSIEFSTAATTTTTRKLNGNDATLKIKKIKTEKKRERAKKRTISQMGKSAALQFMG